MYAFSIWCSQGLEIYLEKSIQRSSPITILLFYRRGSKLHHRQHPHPDSRFRVSWTVIDQHQHVLRKLTRQGEAKRCNQHPRYPLSPCWQTARQIDIPMIMFINHPVTRTQRTLSATHNLHVGSPNNYDPSDDNQTHRRKRVDVH